MRWLVGLAGIALALATCRTYDTVYTDDAGGQCALPSLLCNQVCVDPRTDRSNCGGCGNACLDNELCIATADGGPGCVACPSSQVACGANGAAFCTDTQNDARNCGSCGKACDTGSTCKNGKCSCPLTTCGTACIDTTTDVSNCGGCNVVCPAGGPNENAICTQSHCGVVCAPLFADCDGMGGNGCESNLQTGPTSCGACGRACASGDPCTAGMCPTATYAKNATQLGGTATDGTFVYWGDRGSTGAIVRAPVGGGNPQTYFTDNASTLLATDGTHLVWLDLNTTIQSRLLTGGAVTSLVTTSGIVAIYVDGGFVYYGASAGVVARVPVDGSSGSTTITSVPSPRAIVADGTNVYVASATGFVAKAPIAGQSVIATTFAASTTTEDLAIDATNVYWLATNGDVVTQSKSATNQVKLATKQSIASNANLVTDGTLLFWPAVDGTIRELPVAGGKPLVIASNETGAASIAVDATRVYWTTPDHVSSTSK